jgi:hypothetical protein
MQGNHTYGEGGFKLDAHSDLFEETLGGVCRSCMILGLRYDVTDNAGMKLTAKDEVYTHHMVLASDMSGEPMTPLKVNRSCMSGIGGRPLDGFPLPPRHSSGSALPKNSALPNGPLLPEGAIGPGGPPGFKFPSSQQLSELFANPPVIIINKGQEKNTVNFMSLDQNQPKSGFWIGNNDTIMTSVEIVNYKTTPQDVYLTLDLEYLDFDVKPKTYFKTEFAALPAMECGAFDLRKLILKISNVPRYIYTLITYYEKVLRRIG